MNFAQALHMRRVDMVYDTPQDLFMYKGMTVRDSVEKLRAFTKKGLATRLGITLNHLNKMSDKGPEWEQACQLIDQVIDTQQFEGAAAGLLNASLVTRSLGLAEKTEHTGKDGGPIVTAETSARDIIASRLAGLASGARAAADFVGDDEPAA